MHLFYKVLFDLTDPSIPSIKNIVLIATCDISLQQHSNHAMLGVHASAQSIINYGKVARKHHLIGPSLDSLSRYVDRPAEQIAYMHTYTPHPCLKSQADDGFILI